MNFECLEEDDEIEQLVDCIKVVKLPKDVYAMYEGEDATFIGLLLHGSASVNFKEEKVGTAPWACRGDVDRKNPNSNPRPGVHIPRGRGPQEPKPDISGWG